MSENKENKTSFNNENNKKAIIKNNKTNSYSLPKQNNNLKNKRAWNKMNNKENKLKINLTSKMEFLYNDSQNKTVNSNKKIKLINNNIINLTSNNQNSTDFLSTKYKKNSRQSNNKNTFQTRTFSEFWSSVQENEKKKKTRINNLKQQIAISQNKEIKNRPYISKRSLSLANIKKRKPFYLKKPLNEERYLEEDFINFYKKYLGIINKEKEKSIDEQKTQEKFSKFYEDNINWKNKIIKCNQLIYEKNRKNAHDKKVYTFKPNINRNSVKIVEELDKFNEMASDDYIDLNNSELDKKLMDQFKLKIKSVLNQYLYRRNKNTPYVNKRSLNLLKCSTQSNRTKHLNRNKSYQIIPKRKMMEEEQKDNNLSSKEEKENDKLKFPKKRTYEKYLLEKFKQFNNLDRNNKKDLYKLNIRQGTSTNNEYANKIIPDKKYHYIIEGLF